MIYCIVIIYLPSMEEAETNFIVSVIIIIVIIMISHGDDLVIICFISWSWSRLLSSSSSQSTSSQNCPPFIWRIWAIWYILIFHSCHLGKLSPIGDKYCKSVAKENLGEIPMQWYFMLQKPKYSGNPKVKFSKDQHFSHISPWKGKVKTMTTSTCICRVPSAAQRRL